MKWVILLIYLYLLANVGLNGQQITQTIRGTVIDKVSKQTLPGASVELIDSDLSTGTTTDVDGNFRLLKVPIGREGIRISFIGYKTVSIHNLIVNSGKETVLQVELEENIVTMNEVVVTAENRKNEALNKMASVSARSFTVEETEKFAGSRGDVARMAMNFAGVMAANDARNDIIIRGNSPSGLLWKLDDVEIPNPNHFAENGTTGGPVSMINNNLLTNSDFLTGAFPAEYGNALSGVFDLKMRNGNNEKHEFLGQCGFNGFELSAEGPFTKNHKSSYLISARYSTLELVSKVVNFGTAGVPKYKDVSFKLNFPLNNAKITVFGIGGVSQISMLDSKKTGSDLYLSDGTNLYNHSSTSVLGTTYTKFVNNKTYFKIISSGMYMEGGTNIDTFNTDYTLTHNSIHESYVEKRATLAAVFNSKINSKIHIRSGISVDRMGFNLGTKVFNATINDYKIVLNNNKNLNEGPDLFKYYVQSTYKFSEQLSINPGVHFMYFDLNNKFAIEPRLGLSWQFAENKKLSIGYGLLSKIQTLYTYYYLTLLPDHSYIQTNKGLDFTKSNQYVLGYDWNIAADLRLRLEGYYQSLFKVPVTILPGSFSLLNEGAAYGANTSDSLVNKGTGRNYGLEMTFEKFFNRNYYYLVTLSLFESKYKGSDGVLRNTAFNGNYVLNCLFGKEFKLDEKKAIALDMKMTYAGGIRYTPIDTLNSRLSGEEKLFDNLAFSKQFPRFLKIDVKVGFRLNGRKVSQEWQFFIENVTGHKNYLSNQYNTRKNSIETTYQLGFYPMMLYRLNF
jgi:hypothetical protein